jgi:penicillin-binding protein 1A
MVAGCYIGYDTPTPLGRNTYGGNTCGPVFNEFMQAAVEKYGGGAFRVPPGGQFINIDRFSGAQLSPNADGDNVVAEYFRLGEEPVFGVAFDGGFAMGSNLPLFDEVNTEIVTEVITSTGESTVVTPSASFGTLSSGGLY